MAKKSSSAQIIVPSLIHFRVGHFAAVTAQNRGKYRLQDPTFDESGSIWITAKAIESQGDGYFLVPAGQLPSGWQKVSKSEGATVWGKGDSGGRDGQKGPGTPKQSPGPGPGGSCNLGMAAASAFAMQIDVNIQDTPLSYSPPIGGPMNFLANFNEEEQGQPPSFSFPNLTACWSLNWISWVTFDASNNATVSTRGGGIEQYPYTEPDNVSNPYLPSVLSQAQFVIAGDGIYQRQLPDGSIEVFSLSDTAGHFFMTQVIDPQGNAVNINWNTTTFQVTSITDATGLVTTINYVSGSGVGEYLISQISDPLGRSASFAYDATNTYLVAITDAVGNVSQFSYTANSSFINTLKTPYGQTSFVQYTPPGSSTFPPKGLIYLFPDGTHSTIENWIGETKSTYFWDREASSLYPNDPENLIYSHCKTTKWLYDATTAYEAPVINWVKKPSGSAGPLHDTGRGGAGQSWHQQ